MVKTELFIYKMLNLYKDHEETLEGMVKLRDDDTFKELCVDDKEIEHWKVIFKLYDEHKTLKTVNEEISKALYVTCLWYIHLNIKMPVFEVIIINEDTGKEYINYGGISDHLIKKYMITTFGNMPYLFINGRFYEDKGRLEKDVVKLLKNCEFSRTQKTEHIVKEIKYRIRKETSKFREYPFNTKSKYLIPVENGAVPLRAGHH